MNGRRMVSKIITVHGIRSSGEGSTDLLGDELAYRGLDTTQYDYKRVGMWDVLFNLRESQKRGMQYERAKGLKELASQYDRPTVIAHSFGALLTLRAMEMGAELGNVFFYRPAMNRDFIFPVWGLQRLHIIHSPDDKAVKAGSMLALHSFGEMGTLGSIYAPPEGKDHRIRNYRSQFNGHSGDFREGLSYTADFIEEKLR